MMNSLMHLLFTRAQSRFVLFAFAAFLAGSASPAPGNAQRSDDPNRIRIGGTGSAVGTARLLSAEFMKSRPVVRVDVLPSLGSSGAIKAVIEGALDIGLVSRPLSEEERGRGVVGREYGRSPFVFATSAHNPVDEIRLDELIEIYEGRKTNWPNGEPIRLILRPISDTDTVLLKSMWPAMNTAVEKAADRAGMMTAVTDQDGADAIERIPGALGTSSLSLIRSEKRRMKALALNGIRPSVKALRDGAYPYYKTFYIVTRTRPSGIATRFIEFMHAPSGRAILVNTGHWIIP